MDLDSRLHEAGHRWRESQGPALQPPSLDSSPLHVRPSRWRKGFVPVAAAAAAAGIVLGMVGLHEATTSNQVPAGSTSTSPSSVSLPSPKPSTSASVSSPGSAPTCRTSQLSVRLGNGGVAAGTTYRPIVFTNRGRSTCALRGYPGVAFVDPATGRQMGSAASHNPQQPGTTTLIAPASSASALLGIANYGNYPSKLCLSHPVSGLRIYPPGNTMATYVPFESASTACSTQVEQLNVAAVVTGSTGQ
jgi:hypothetical protein